MSSENLKKTALVETHEELGAKMVDFAGFYMPIVYSSILEEHRCIRNGVGVFDVSHMGEFKISGPGALDLIQRVTINDASQLTVGQVQYSAMCYPDGGIVDDLLVYRFEDYYMLVVNAANLEKDLNWIKGNTQSGEIVEDLSDDFTLLAVQGPKSLELIQKISSTDISGLEYYHAIPGEVAGEQMLISRTGYTGELGVELYMDNESGKKVWDTLFKEGAEYGIKPIGLGARDTLRLEKKMALYGNDISKDTNPLEASLGWITKLDKGDFIGREALAKVKEEGVTRRLVAFESMTRALPRHGFEIVVDDQIVGEVTSGGFSPMLEKGIGLGYVKTGFGKIGNEIMIRARGKDNPAVIIKPPFV